MKELFIATGNLGKLKELSALLEGVVQKLYSVQDFPDLPPVDEDGVDFAANACKKAASACKATGMAAVADDSGLVVDALGGRPGVLSARYAGEGAGDEANNAKLLHELAAVPLQARSAAFHCVVALFLPDGQECRTFSGKLKGLVLTAPRGENGFGYDPLFFLPEYELTMAELPFHTKNSISHRAKALFFLKEHLSKNLP